MYINYHENETWLGVYWAYGVLIMEFPVYRSFVGFQISCS